MVITRTYEEGFIYRCITHKRIWPHLRDDASPEPELFFPDMLHTIWLNVSQDKSMINAPALNFGVFMAHQINAITWETHCALLPVAWGYAVLAAECARDWMFEHTPCTRLIASIVEDNHLAIRMAKRAGFTQYGLNKNSFLRDGKLHNELLFGVSAGDI